ncbi:MAG TPA: BTAD domain-containing putative transcriptional regulator, partial [Gaiellaceae bacterium]|nr:BTAD domain-containing putative transcriptional regulator [Gaiellaceae bacterium]
LAEALELAGAAAEERSVAVSRFEEARAIYHSIGSRLGVAWTELRLAQVSDTDDARELAERAARRFRELGARRGAAAADVFLAELDLRARPAVEIRTLGGFAVLRAGEPVPHTEWQSKKARDLLKILVSRRGHPVTRELLMEALWPDQSPDKLAGRLSVALTTVRTVLDPEKKLDREHFVIGDKGTVRLDLAHLVVDVERFLVDAQSALAARRESPSPEATERLELVEALYAGDFLEEDAYEDWPVPLREEALAMYIGVARALAEDAGDSGDAAAATKFFLRILERDRYDEHAHLGLVSALVTAGRHGEAQRFYRSYCAGMEQIGVEAASFPALSRP